MLGVSGEALLFGSELAEWGSDSSFFTYITCWAKPGAILDRSLVRLLFMGEAEEFNSLSFIMLSDIFF